MVNDELVSRNSSITRSPHQSIINSFGVSSGFPPRPSLGGHPGTRCLASLQRVRPAKSAAGPATPRLTSIGRRKTPQLPRLVGSSRHGETLSAHPFQPTRYANILPHLSIDD